MTDKTMLAFAEKVKAMIAETATIEEKGDKVIVSGTLGVGIKGMDTLVEYSDTTVKIKGSRQYEYPITDASSDKFQQDMQHKYKNYSIYVTGQTLQFSKFFSYETTAEAEAQIQKALQVMKDAVLAFEETCVNFMEKNPKLKETEQYNPEDNIEIVNVDNSFHAVSATQQDNEEYEAGHQNYTKKVFAELATKIGAAVDGNEAVKTEESGRVTKLMALPLDGELIMSVMVPAPSDIGAMYVSYMNANYKELRSSYHPDKEEFIIRAYAYPDPYSPEEAEDLWNLCNKAMDACIKNYEDTLEKKDSIGFAVDVQQLLEEQTEALSERERVVAERETTMAEKEEELKAKEGELEKRLQELEEEKAQMQAAIEQERAEMQQREDEMADKIRDYEDRNVKDILNIKQLANQVATLQNRQNMVGAADNDAEEERFRLQSKVNQLINQKIALEKKLNEKITGKETRIRQLSDVVTEKETEIQQMKNNMNDMVKSLVADETKKTAAHIKQLEQKVASAGHTLTPEDMLEYLEQVSDVEASKRHASNAEFVVYEDGALEIRMRFGDVNYIDVTTTATLKDSILRKLNTKFSDYKFFSTKDGKITARGYFSKTATAEEVDELIESISENFSK